MYFRQRKPTRCNIASDYVQSIHEVNDSIQLLIYTSVSQDERGSFKSEVGLFLIEADPKKPLGTVNSGQRA